MKNISQEHVAYTVEQIKSRFADLAEHHIRDSRDLKLLNVRVQQLLQDGFTDEGILTTVDYVHEKLTRKGKSKKFTPRNVFGTYFNDEYMEAHSDERLDRLHSKREDIRLAKQEEKERKHAILLNDCRQFIDGVKCGVTKPTVRQIEVLNLMAGGHRPFFLGGKRCPMYIDFEQKFPPNEQWLAKEVTWLESRIPGVIDWLGSKFSKSIEDFIDADKETYSNQWVKQDG